MINPILASSSKRRMRSVRTPLLLTLYSVFLLLVSMSSLGVLAGDTLRITDMRRGIDTYVYLAALQFALILLIAPALTAGSISGERERQTLDLLLCTRMGPLRILFGKLLSSAAFFLLLIFSTMPAMSVVFLFGGITPWMLLRLTLLLMVTALAALSIGLFSSALFKRTMTSTVVAYLAVFALGIGTVLYPLIFQRQSLDQLIQSVQSYSGTYGMVSIAATTAGEAVPALPKLFYLNPGIALAALMVEQTGILRSTLNNFVYGSYQVLDQFSGFVNINMIVLLCASLLLILLSALFLKPRAPRFRKAKKS